MLKSTTKKELVIVLSLVGALVLILLVYLLVDYTEQKSSLQTQNTKTIGVAFDVNGKVLYRDSRSLDWYEVGSDGTIYSNQFLFTHEKSQAKYVFLDDSTVLQSEETLLHINSKFDLLGTLYEEKKVQDKKDGKRPPKSRRPVLELELVDGEIFASIGKKGMVKQIKTNGGTVSPETEEFSEVIVKNRNDEFAVDVIKGQVNLKAEDGADLSIRERESYTRSGGKSGTIGSVSDKKVAKYQKTGKDAKKASKGKAQERKGFDEFLSEIMSIFLPFL